MKFTGCEALPRLAAVAATLALAPLLSSGPAHAQAQQPIVMKISLAALNEALHQFAKDYAALIEKDSGGRIKTEIYPASQLGLDPAADRRHAVRRHPVRGDAAGILFRRRRTLSR